MGNNCKETLCNLASNFANVVPVVFSLLQPGFRASLVIKIFYSSLEYSRSVKKIRCELYEAMKIFSSGRRCNVDRIQTNDKIQSGVVTF